MTKIYYSVYVCVFKPPKALNIQMTSLFLSRLPRKQQICIILTKFVDFIYNYRQIWIHIYRDSYLNLPLFYPAERFYIYHVVTQ